MSKKLGRDLKVGDTIKVWWGNGRDTITTLTPYHGSLRHLWDKDGGAKLADFSLNKVGMTIEPIAIFDVIEAEMANNTVGNVEYTDELDNEDS